MTNCVATVFISASLCICGVGCGCTAPPTTVSDVGSERDERDEPLVKESQPAAEKALDGLFSGKFDGDSNYAPVARKVKGFNSWAIDHRKVVGQNPPAVDFRGALRATKGKTNFTLRMVKQQGGKWMIGTFELQDSK